MPSWRVLTPGGKLSSKQFSSRSAQRAYTREHPGYKRLEYSRRLGPAPPPKGQRAAVRGHAVPAAREGVFRHKDVFRGGNRLVSVNEMFRFVADSYAPCLSVNFLVGGNQRPLDRNVRVEQQDLRTTSGKRLFESPKKFGPDEATQRILGTVPGESKMLDRDYVEQIILEENTLIGIASRLRPDITFEEGSYVYGWEIIEGNC